jgi:hypothetical protein
MFSSADVTRVLPFRSAALLIVDEGATTIASIGDLIELPPDGATSSSCAPFWNASAIGSRFEEPISTAPPITAAVTVEPDGSCVTCTSRPASLK